jgi:hypothetical protein
VTARPSLARPTSLVYLVGVHVTPVVYLVEVRATPVVYLLGVRVTPVAYIVAQLLPLHSHDIRSKYDGPDGKYIHLKYTNYQLTFFFNLLIQYMVVHEHLSTT